MKTIEDFAIEHWMSGSPVNSSYPDEERQGESALLVPLYHSNDVVNVLSIGHDGKPSAYSAEIVRPGRNSATKANARTVGAVAVAGRAAAEDGAGIAGAKIAGAEQWYACGRLAGAKHVYLTVGWDNAARIFAETGTPAVAALEGSYLRFGRATEGGNLMDIALELRQALPAEALITIAVADDRTSTTQQKKRLADIEACQAEEFAQEIAEAQNSKEWKRRETQEAAERLRHDALTITTFDSAMYVADRIGARLLALNGAEA